MSIRVKQWKYFWSWALLSAFLFTLSATCVLYLTPRIYSGTLVAQPLEIYSGEDLTLPNPPEGVTFSKIEGTQLIEVRSLHPEPDTAADRANEFFSDWLRQRIFLRRSEIASRQTEIEFRSADWATLELQRRNLSSGGVVHVPATPSTKPLYPKIETFLWTAIPLSVAVGMVVAFLLMRRRGEQPGDGAILGAAEIGKRFVKIAPVLCGLFVAISMAVFLQQPHSYRSTATLEFLPHDRETFLTKLEILKSRTPVLRAVEDEKLSTLLGVNTANEAVDELLVGLEITGDRETSTAVIQFAGHHQNLVELLPGAIANAFIARGVETTNWETERSRGELESAAWIYSDTPFLVAEAEAKIARLSDPASAKEIATITAVGLPETLAKDWIGWLRETALIEIIRGFVWGLFATFVSLLYLTRFREKLKVPTQVFTPQERKNGSVFDHELSRNPY